MVPLTTQDSPDEVDAAIQDKKDSALGVLTYMKNTTIPKGRTPSRTQHSQDNNFNLHLFFYSNLVGTTNLSILSAGPLSLLCRTVLRHLPPVSRAGRRRRKNLHSCCPFSKCCSNSTCYFWSFAELQVILLACRSENGNSPRYGCHLLASMYTQ